MAYLPSEVASSRAPGGGCGCASSGASHARASCVRPAFASSPATCRRAASGWGTANARSQCAIASAARPWRSAISASAISARAATSFPEGADFEWHGELLQVSPPRTILPRPVQMPHPPLFLACTKHDTVTLAADYGIGALVLGFAGPDEVRELRTIYDAAVAARSGKRFVSSQTNEHFAALCPTIVLDDRTEARQVGARGQRFFAQAIAHWYGGGPPPDEDTDPTIDEVAAIEDAADRMVAFLHESQVPVAPTSTATFHVDHGYGDHRDAIAYAERLADAGADEIMCLVQMGTVPQSACLETIRQWGTHVIPHLRART